MNLVLTMGTIGDESTVRILSTFLEGQGAKDPIAVAEYLAKSNVPVALGYLVNQAKDRATHEAALNYLAKGLDLAYWAKHLTWHSSVEPDDGVRDINLMYKTLDGLAVSGDDDAHSLLVGFQGRVRAVLAATRSKAARLNAVDAALSQLTDDDLCLLDERAKNAIDINRVVKRLGLVRYYQ